MTLPVTCDQETPDATSPSSTPNGSPNSTQTKNLVRDLLSALEIQPQRELPCPVAAVLRRLHARSLPERRRRRKIHRRRSKIWVIQHVCKRALEPQAQTLPDLKRLRQSSRDGGRARSDKNTHSAIPNSPRIRCRIRKCTGVEVLQRGRVCQVAVADAVRL